MINVEKVKSEEYFSDFLVRTYLSTTNINIDEEGIEVKRFEDDNIYRVHISKEKINSSKINKLMNCSFQEFLKNDTNNNFVVVYPLETIFEKDSLFEEFEPSISIAKKDNRAFIGISLINPWEFKNKEWERFSPHYIENILKTEFLKGKFKSFLLEDDNKSSTSHDIVADEGLFISKDFKSNENINKSLTLFIKGMGEIQNRLLSILTSIPWLKDFEVNEAVFSKSLLLPLLQQRGYHNVKYNHGTLEFGRDFIFSEYSKFDEEIHYGMQVKAGNLKGNVKSEIEEIISQIKDSFEMPFYKLGDKSEFYISICIVAISGKFTQNAKLKIRQKLNNGKVGKVFFWDKEKILELMKKE